MNSQPLIFPPWLFQPQDGFPFDYTAYLATPAVGNNVAVVRFTVPQGHFGVIRKIGNVYIGVGFVEGSGSLVWQIQQNAGVVRNYDNILSSLGTVSAPTELSGSILLYEQNLVTLQVNNVGLVAGGTQVGGRLSGWFFPKDYLTDNPDAMWG